MEGLLERLARLSLKKSNKLLKKGGQIGGAIAGNMVAPGVGGFIGSQAGQALGGGIGSSLEALSESGRRNPYEFQMDNVANYQHQPTFAQNWAGKFGESLGGQGADILGDYAQSKIPTGVESEEGLTPEQEIEALLEGLTPEAREAILAKYMGAR